jgi:hypothetical protein
MPRHVSDSLEHERALLLELKRLIDGRLEAVDRLLTQAGEPQTGSGLTFLLGGTPTEDYSDVTIVEAMRRELEAFGAPMSGPAMAMALLSKGARTRNKNTQSFTSNLHQLAKQKPEWFVRVGRNWDLVSRHKTDGKSSPRTRKTG